MQEEQEGSGQLEVTVPAKLKEQKINNNDPKFAEVNALMNKYDTAEQRIRWLNSPEYAQQQQEKERKTQEAKNKQIEEEKKRKENEVDPRQLARQKEEIERREKENKEAIDKQFLETTVDKYAMKQESEDQHSVITKDKAYLAASECVTHFKDMRGRENFKFLEKHFEKTWSEFDDKHHNFLTLESGNSFMNSLMEIDE